ncbi:anthranilate synthase component I [Myxococcaceae bacterium]|nr:anthranilate synthase component I [Myxococcaceae bacterium]
MKPPLRAACAARTLARASDLLAFLPALRRAGGAWLLDSALAGGPLARFSFAGADPWLVLSARGKDVTLQVRRPARDDLAPGVERRACDPLDLARELLAPPPDTLPPGIERLPFAGGAVACLGYGLAGSLEPVAFAPRRAEGLPDLVFYFVDRMLALDHASGAVIGIATGMGRDADAARRRAEQGLGELERSLSADPPAPARAGAGRNPAPETSAGVYAALVSAVKERIEAGDVYQACLTHRIERAVPEDPWSVYTRLRRISPAPFAAYLELPGLVLLSSSPERFLRVDPGGRVETRPIKGTRPRGETPWSDAKLRAELVASAKDRAENVMIVDLARNDLGRVCRTASVRVDSLCAVEAYATVFQLVSTVSGVLAPGLDAIDAVRATFPPGSMTGAPKRAAVTLLDSLEASPRGFYSGALGYFDARGGADLAVVIRSIFVRDGVAALHVGGGVVADSDPFAEHRESLDKARALRSALGETDQGIAGPAVELAPGRRG